MRFHNSANNSPHEGHFDNNDIEQIELDQTDTNSEILQEINEQAELESYMYMVLNRLRRPPPTPWRARICRSPRRRRGGYDGSRPMTM